MILIDSNIWCYYFDQSCPENAEVAKAVDNTLAIKNILSNTVVIMEVSHFLVRNLGPRIGKEKLDILLSFPMTISEIDISLMKESIDMLCNYSHVGICGRDATLLASLKKFKTNKIMTHDADFKKIDWLDVIDPVQR